MRLHNTLSGSVEEFVPRDAGRVGMYVCGPTVQGEPHFGHARAEIVPDVLRRYLAWRGYQVFHVRNITDVDDKIIARAEAQDQPAAAVAERYATVWQAQIARLGTLAPHVAPRATGHIIEMLELITRLVEADVAYEAGGDVFFSVRAFPEYGKLSGRKPDELRAGARVAADERKRDPLDFALWKAAKQGEGSVYEPSWPSPWGPGRPGWHIECSAMAGKYLGAGFDIHAGGADLVFPHHENEIAQSEAATGRPFARYWVHNGMLTLGAEKMSKSVGNIISLSQAIDRYGAATVRLFYLRADYRSPVEFMQERLAEASAALERFEAFLRAAAGLDAPAEPHALAEEARAAFREALDDDLSTPRALAVLFDLASRGNQELDRGHKPEAAAARDALVELAGVLGLSLDPAAGGETGLVAPLIEELLRLRADARTRRDFDTADGIRARLGELGVVVEDRADGVTWHLARGRR